MEKSGSWTWALRPDRCFALEIILIKASVNENVMVMMGSVPHNRIFLALGRRGRNCAERAAALLEERRSNPVDKLTWPGYPSAVARKVREQNPEKVKIAKRLRMETAMTWGWIARQLCMGARGFRCEPPQEHRPVRTCDYAGPTPSQGGQAGVEAGGAGPAEAETGS